MNSKEQEAQIIIDRAIEHLRELGYGVVADGTVYGMVFGLIRCV